MTNHTIAGMLGLPRKTISHPTAELSEHTRNIGIEIEVEDVDRRRLRDDLGHLWDVTSDGSLRPPEASAELRSPVPGYCGRDLVDSVNILSASDSLANASFGWRCANHIHVDMRDKEIPDLHMTCTLHALIEPYIFSWDGTGRQESRFCMPWWVCAGDVLTAGNILKSTNRDDFSYNLGNFSKYTSLNLQPLRRQGTIELRHSKAGINKDNLLEFIDIGMSLANCKERFKEVSPIAMVKEYISMPIEEFVGKWFYKRAASALLRPTPNKVVLAPAIIDRATNTAMLVAGSGSGSIKHSVIPPKVSKQAMNFFMGGN